MKSRCGADLRRGSAAAFIRCNTIASRCRSVVFDDDCVFNPVVGALRVVVFDVQEVASMSIQV